jgi:hypothetical protein
MVITKKKFSKQPQICYSTFTDSNSKYQMLGKVNGGQFGPPTLPFLLIGLVIKSKSNICL